MNESALLSQLGESAPASVRERGSVWGKVAEFLVVGGGTLFLFPLAWLARNAVGLDRSEYAFGFLTFYAAYVINDPHFAVTYVLFYGDVKARAFGREYSAAQRARYWLAGLIVPLVLAAWVAFAMLTRSADALGWMVQLMFVLVGWHYVKQGFGVLTVLSARRGVAITTNERRVLLAHCYAGWAFAWANPASPAGEFEEKGVVYHALAHPHWFELTMGVALALSSVSVVWVLVAKWRRERRTIPAAPLTGLLVSVWLWSIFSSVDPLVRYVIPALHSVQYGYFVWLMKRNEARSQEGEPHFGTPAAFRVAGLFAAAIVLGWLLFRGIPGLLDAATAARPRRGIPLDDFGATPFFAAFYVVVNVHHYFMDTVIWRRDNPLTRHLRTL